VLTIIKILQKTFPFSYTESFFRIRFFSISSPGFQKSSPGFLKDESGSYDFLRVWVRISKYAYISKLDWVYRRFIHYLITLLGPVVQRWVSANPGLKFNQLCLIVYVFLHVHLFQNFREVNSYRSRQDFWRNMSKLIYRQAVRKFALNFRFTQG
jgi:hypothetical protein